MPIREKYDHKDLEELLERLGYRKGKAELEWFIDQQFGSEFPKQYQTSFRRKGITPKDYCFTYTGIVLGIFKTPPPRDTLVPIRNEWLFWHPDDPCKPVMMCRVRIRCEGVEPYLDVIYEDPPKIEIKGITPKTRDEDVKALLGARRIFSRGPWPGYPKGRTRIPKDESARFKESVEAELAERLAKGKPVGRKIIAGTIFITRLYLPQKLGHIR